MREESKARLRVIYPAYLIYVVPEVVVGKLCTWYLYTIAVRFLRNGRKNGNNMAVFYFKKAENFFPEFFLGKFTCEAPALDL